MILSGSPGPAPGRLALVQRFVNTVDLELERDLAATPEGLAGCLVELGLMQAGDPATEADVVGGQAVREALRGLLLANHDQRLPYPVDLATLNQAAARARLRLRFQAGGAPRLEPEAAGTDGALGRLVAIVSAAMADGSWSRLKACRADSCRRAFYDHSRNRSGAWCSMAVCGNRTKARRYREGWRQAPVDTGARGLP